MRDRRAVMLHNSLVQRIGRIFRSTTLPWLVLVAGIPASVFLASLIQNSVENLARVRFEREANDVDDIIQGRLRSYSDVLYSLRALFSSDQQIDRLRFRRFLDSLDLKLRYPGFISINYAAYVPAREKANFEASVRRDTSLDARGYPGFRIRPPGKRDEYFVIVYLEPMAGYEFAFGLDLGANPMADDPGKVAATVKRQRDSGRLIASGQPLRVKRAREAIYLAMRLPVYRIGVPVDTVSQRRAAYVGSVGAAFDVEYLMREALDQETSRTMRVRLYDAGSAIDGPAAAPPPQRRLLFDSSNLGGGSPAPSTEGASTHYQYVLPVEVASRIWEFHYSAPKNLIISATDRLLPRLILAGGVLSTLLMFVVLYSLSYSRSRAMRIAGEMTRDLRTSEEGLRASAVQLQALSRSLVDVQESERRQFARELHDRVGQNLTALSISLDILKTQIPPDSNAAARARIDDAAALLDDTAVTIENVMSELRPPMLDDYGLLPALQWYAAAFAGRTGIDVSVHGDEAMPRLPPAIEIGLFRIVQEALNNVAKHAGATRMEISLEHDDGEFLLAVRDNGVGFPADTVPAAGRRQGLGMVTMRERTQAIGGRFEIGNAAGGGTRLAVRIAG